MATMVSQFLSLEEAIYSNTALKLGINNMPNTTVIKNIELTAQKIYDPLFEQFGNNLVINSFFRSEALNKAIKGAPKSDHMLGRAIDMELKNSSNLILADFILEHLAYDQLIYEYPVKGNVSWVHTSYRNENRQQALIAHRSNGRLKYSPYDSELLKLLIK